MSLLLPSENSRTGVPDQGWLVEMEVKPSGIPGAGNGRYAAQPVKERDMVCVKPLVPMAEVFALRDVPYDHTYTFACAEDLEKYITLAQKEGGYTREQVLDQFENFVWGLDERRACLNNSTWTMNHGEGTGETVVFQLEAKPDGTEAVVGYAYQDLEPGAEFFNNYRDFVIPLWYRDWTQANGIVDVRTLVLTIVDGGGCGEEPLWRGHDSDPARLPEGKVGFGDVDTSCKICEIS
jgi:hypothetical protein